MTNIIILALLFFISVMLLFFRKQVAERLTQKYVKDLERRNDPNERIVQKKQKIQKDLLLVSWITGIFFLVISSTILILETFGLFSGTENAEVLVIDNPLESIWSFVGWIFFIGIFFYVLEWYGLFKWPWRK